MKPSQRKQWRNVLILVLAIAGTWVLQQQPAPTQPWRDGVPPAAAPSASSPSASSSRTPGPAVGADRTSAPQATAATRSLSIEQAFAQQRSDVLVQASGTVQRVLSDDNQGSRHQRFIVELASGHTVLIAHNIDLAPRIPGIQAGDAIRWQGEYEWNDRGGVVHWTHHDPRGQYPGGWIEYRGQRYQ